MRWLMWIAGATICFGAFGGASAQDSAARADLDGNLPQDIRTRVESGGDSNSLLFPVVVAKGQTLSGLSFRHLGAYTPAIRGALLADNPGLVDPSRIFQGETLLFRRSADRRGLAPEKQVAMALRQAVVTSASGPGEILRADGKKEVLAADMFLSPGDVVRAEAGSMVELIVDNQSVLRLRGPARMSLVAVQSPATGEPRPRTQVRLLAGTIWAKVQKWAGPLVHFEVILPNAIAGVHGTVFEAIVNDDGTSLVRVHEGVVAVESSLHPESEVSVRAGQEVSTDRKGIVSRPRPKSARPGAWEKFNRGRDQEIEAGASIAGEGQRSEPAANPAPVRRDITAPGQTPQETQSQQPASAGPVQSPRNRPKATAARP